MADYCFPSNTTRGAMIRGKKAMDLDEAFRYAYCEEGYIRGIREGVVFCLTTKPSQVPRIYPSSQ